MCWCAWGSGDGGLRGHEGCPTPLHSVPAADCTPPPGYDHMVQYTTGSPSHSQTTPSTPKGKGSGAYHPLFWFSCLTNYAVLHNCHVSTSVSARSVPMLTIVLHIVKWILHGTIILVFFMAII